METSVEELKREIPRVRKESDRLADFLERLVGALEALGYARVAEERSREGGGVTPAPRWLP
jgi:hypothetical protein